PYRILPAAGEGMPRVLVAPEEEADVAIRQLIVEPLPGGRVRLRNESVGRALTGVRRDLAPQETIDVEFPARLLVSTREIELDRPDEFERGALLGSGVCEV